MSFHVGEKVVCVDDNWRYPQFDAWWPIKPIKGVIYTVRELRFSDEGDGMLLYEIRNPIMRWADGLIGEGSFCNSHFRPLTERKTDISIFKQILADASKEKEAAE